MTDTGAPISIPVGNATLGRILNVVGEPVDEKGPVSATETRAIHQPAPEFNEQSTESEILVTGIKVIDLLAPYSKGGKIGLFGGAGVGEGIRLRLPDRPARSSLDFVTISTEDLHWAIVADGLTFLDGAELERLIARSPPDSPLGAADRCCATPVTSLNST